MKGNHSEWGPWRRHDGKGMPVRAGTIVEAISDRPRPPARGGIIRRKGIAGVDLVNSWNWTPETRLALDWLPIDYYRVKRPKGFGILARRLAEIESLEDA